MRTLAFTLTRHTVADPLTVAIVQNDIGQVPEWFIDGPSTYRAVFAAPIGSVPKQVITVLGDVFRYIVVEPNGDRELTINTMINDGLAFEADLTGDFVSIVILDELTQTAAV